MGRDVSTEAGEAIGDAITAKRAYIEVLAVFLAFLGSGVINAAISIAGARPDNGSVGWAAIAGPSFDLLAEAGLALTVVIVLSHRRNRSLADLGLATKGRLSLGQGIRVAAWATLGLIGGSIVTSALASANFPFGPDNNAYTVYGLFSAINAGIVEETVVLAFVVVTLSQARRPWPEIVVVALLLRVSYHIYYGPGALGVVVWAGVFLWLFRRYHSLVPLIAVHIAWDTVGFVGRRWPAVGGVGVIVVAALFITAPILWLVERSNDKHPEPPPRRPLPGWYPDPTGPDQLRWWDGWVWTGFAVPHQFGPQYPPGL